MTVDRDGARRQVAALLKVVQQRVERPGPDVVTVPRQLSAISAP